MPLYLYTRKTSPPKMTKDSIDHWYNGWGMIWYQVHLVYHPPAQQYNATNTRTPTTRAKHDRTRAGAPSQSHGEGIPAYHTYDNNRNQKPRWAPTPAIVIRTHDGPQNRVSPNIFPNIYQPSLVLITMIVNMTTCGRSITPHFFRLLI